MGPIKVVADQMGALQRQVIGLIRAEQLGQEVAPQGLLGLAHGLLFEPEQGGDGGSVLNRQFIQVRQGMITGHDPDITVNRGPQ